MSRALCIVPSKECDLCSLSTCKNTPKVSAKPCTSLLQAEFAVAEEANEIVHPSSSSCLCPRYRCPAAHHILEEEPSIKQQWNYALQWLQTELERVGTERERIERGERERERAAMGVG